MTTQELLTKIEKFCQRNKIAPSRFGRDAVGASNLLARLRNGKTVTIETAGRIQDFMRGYGK